MLQPTQQQWPPQPDAAAPAGQHFPSLSIPAAAQGDAACVPLSTPAAAPGGFQTVPLTPPSAATTPAGCTDLVLYQPQQHQQQQRLLSSMCGSVGALQQANHTPQTPLQQQQEQVDLDTAHNNNAALKSVWRTLTPAQRRSLAGMWDVIKTEHLLPRLAPTSGLLPLPSTDIDGGDQQQQPWQQQQSCIVEELDDTGADKQQQWQQQQQQWQPQQTCIIEELEDTGADKQQQQAAANGFAAAPAVTCNGFAAAAADTGSADMQVDQQQIPAIRVASVEDMEL